MILDQSALDQIKSLCNNSDERFRVSVVSGGCSGFSYKFSLDSVINNDDTVINSLVVIDNLSLELLRGSTLSYVNEKFNKKFVIFNPNVVSTCGCGTSFTV